MLFRPTPRLKGVDVIDVFYAEYVSPSDDLGTVTGKEGTLAEIWKYREEGKVRFVGVTTHNRPLAVDLIESGRVEVLMHRYNIAHRGAEEKVFPAAQREGLPVVSFTNTRWGSLLRGHPDWVEPVPTAVDCYRYVLRHPALHRALSAPGTL